MAVKVKGQWYTSDPCYGGQPCSAGHRAGPGTVKGPLHTAMRARHEKTAAQHRSDQNEIDFQRLLALEARGKASRAAARKTTRHSRGVESMQRRRS